MVALMRGNPIGLPSFTITRRCHRQNQEQPLWKNKTHTGIAQARIVTAGAGSHATLLHFQSMDTYFS